LLKENLSENQVEQALEVFAQHRVQGSGAGANLTWSADLGFHYGVLTNNLELMNKCRDLIVNEIRITTDEGIQPDYSFHQHGDRLQMFQYGAAFLKENVRLAWECRATSWAFPEEKVKILSDFVLKGWQWMARGIHTVPGTMDRSASRKGELRGPDLRPLIPYLCEIDPEKKDEFLALSERQKGGGIPLQGFRYFPYSDFAAFQTDRFSFFLKTISKRTLATESINNENLKGKLLNSGDAYLIRDGNEYFDLMPVWDWSLLPGITVFNDADHAERKDFVGSVSDGKSGLTVMDYQLEGNEGQVLRAKKFWACHGQTVVCLIAGLEAEHMDGNIRTSLDQCRWQGNVTVNEPGNILNEGDHPLDSVQWIQHAGFACIFPAPSPVTIHLKTKTGSWTSINKSETPEPVTEKVFNAVLEHAAPNKPQNEAYVLAAAETPEQAGAIAEKPSWQIIRNDASCQAVRFTDETAMISFFTPGSVVINNRKLQVDKACLVLISGQQLYASNPSGTQETLQVNYASLAQTIDLPAHGLTSNPVELK
jgi:chondroitin AC lyase